MPNPIRRREFLGGLAATGLAADLLAHLALPALLLLLLLPVHLHGMRP